MITSCAYCKKELNRRPCLIKKGNSFCNASHQMKFEYENGTRDKIKITEKAHETLRLRGHYKRDNSYLSNPNHISEEGRKRISESKKGLKNPMFGKTPWNKLSPTKKWWEEKEFIKLRKVCLKRDKKCLDCGENKKDLYCDHITPYRICREHKLKNLQMLCGSCHSKKTARDIKNYPELRRKIVEVLLCL